MKRVYIKILRFYKRYISGGYYCRMTPSCSEYMAEALGKYGIIKGGWMGVKRVLRCRPGGEKGIDLVE